MITVVKELKDCVGLEVGLSSWIRIDQARIDQFAGVTGDTQYIHVDPVAAEKSAFGGTIAHGFLTLALLPKMIAESVQRPDETETGVNYGLDQVRFISAVPSGAEVRGRFVLAEHEEIRPGAAKMCWDVTVEIKGQKKPALVAKWRSLRVQRSVCEAA